MTLKAIGFDLFGTLLQIKGDHDACLSSQHAALRSQGLNIPLDDFLEAYRSIHAKNRVTRMNSRREVSNCAELCEILTKLGYGGIDADSPQIVKAVEAYFAPWIVTEAEGAHEALQSLGAFKKSVLTNFTDSRFVRKCLANYGFLGMLDCVVVSADVGVRKPSPQIFGELVEALGVRAEEVLFVGDDAAADVVGAKAAGMRTVLVAGENYIRGSGHVEPDFVVSSIRELGAVVREVAGG